MIGIGQLGPRRERSPGWRIWEPSVGRGEREARLAPLVPRFGASLAGDGAVVVFTDGSSMRSAEVVTDGNHIRYRGWKQQSKRWSLSHVEAAFAVASFRPANAGRTPLGRWSSRLEDSSKVQTLSLFTSRYPLPPLPRSAAALRLRVSCTPPSTKRNCHPGNLLSGSALTPGPRRQRAACDSSVRASLRVFGRPSASAGDTQRGTSTRSL